MPRKILLSFLGNNKYIPCCYTAKNFNSGVVHFVQEAIIKLHCEHWTAADRIYLFLTEDAKAKNWLGDHSERGGLQKALQKYEDRLDIQIVEKVPMGLNENQIWQLFDLIYNTIEPEDEIYLDITNAFRSLPMLQMVLLDYAKAMKNVTVKYISYGAFETLGYGWEVKEKYPDPATRLAPILNLNSFSALQDWTKAASDFKNYGKISSLQQLLKSSLEPILEETGKEDQSVSLLQDISLQIEKLIPMLRTNRGKQLQSYDFDQLNRYLRQFLAEARHIKPMTAIIAELQKKVSHFKNEDPLLWLKTAKWCLSHDLIQQGITQLQEGFIQYVCILFQKKYDAQFFKSSSQDAIQLINAAYSFALSKQQEKEWRGAAKRKPELTRLLLNDPFVESTKFIFGKIKGLRNDILHGGYSKNRPAASFAKKLGELITRMERILNKKITDLDALTMPSGLINFSNHPSDKWTEAQLTAAAKYGELTDLDFPDIDPNIDEEALQLLVEEYLEEIILQQPAAVHLMGEMTFTYALVSRLKKVGIPCLASTTHRMVEEKGGKKITTFEFVQFRNYWV